MNLRLSSLGLLLLAPLSLGPLAPAQTPEDEFDAHGFDTVRVEQEDKLLVPFELRDEVWAYLKQRFVDDQEFVRSLDPKVVGSWSEELFHDTYYDTPSLQLYAKKSGVRHRRRENLSNPDDAKSGRELMQIKLNDISSNALERAEIKFEIEYPSEKKSALDSHPLLGIVKPSHRGPFEKRLTELGLDPLSMRPILTVADLRRRVYLKRDGQPFISVSFDRASASVWWGTSEFCEIEPELNEIAFTEADADMRKYMESVLAKIVGDIQQRFPAIRQDLTPKYNKSFDRIEESLPFLRTLVRFGLQSTQGMWIFFGALLFLVFVVYQVIARSRASRARARASAVPARAA